jgi:F-type H+-transporting ATPase subunit delta
MSVTRSYAKALLDAAVEMGMKSSDLDKIEAELADFVGAVGSSRDLRESITSPVVSSGDKAAIAHAIAKKLGISQLTSRFLSILASKGRGPILEEIVEAFTATRLESEGATLGTVVSADPLQQKDLEELATAFSRKLGKKVVFKSAVDPSLLAGLKVTVNGTTYDGSMRAQLQNLRDRLIHGKSLANH